MLHTHIIHNHTKKNLIRTCMYNICNSLIFSKHVITYLHHNLFAVHINTINRLFLIVINQYAIIFAPFLFTYTHNLIFHWYHHE